MHTYLNYILKQFLSISFFERFDQYAADNNYYHYEIRLLGMNVQHSFSFQIRQYSYQTFRMYNINFVVTEKLIN